jgi:hypothetical protein
MRVGKLAGFYEHNDFHFTLVLSHQLNKFTQPFYQKHSV